MADINHTITLGIGTPGAIQEFLTLGLQQGLPAPDPFVTHTANVRVRETATIEVRARETATANTEVG